MPYRIDISCPPRDALDLLVQLGALDIEPVNDGMAVILPDAVAPDLVTSIFGITNVNVSPAFPRDNGSVWLLSPRDVRVGGVLIASPSAADSSKVLRLVDSKAFGTGHHPTTVLCIETLEEILTGERLDKVLDVGTGSGILALSALLMGVPHALGLDIDSEALEIAAENARLNNLSDRLHLVLGGPDAVQDNWPLVVANVLADPLIEMAPALVRRVGKRGKLVLSGIRCSFEAEVMRAFQHLGMHRMGSKTRDGWTAVIIQASW